MIARISILLPFDLLIREGDDLPTLEFAAADYQVRFYPPLLFINRSRITDGALDSAILLGVPQTVAFSDNLLADGKRVALVNVLILDFSKPDFDRSQGNTNEPRIDPDIEFVFAVANTILGKLRVFSRAHQIRELVFGNPVRIRYLTDDGLELEEEKGKVRGVVHGQATVGFPVLTP